MKKPSRRPGQDFKDSGFELTAVLRTLFTSDFFKNARYNKIKSPAELVVSTLRMVGGAEMPRPHYGEDIAMQPTYMGQDLLNPPSVEGWHTGVEWINSGSLMSRINFAAQMVANDLPGVQGIISASKPKGRCLLRRSSMPVWILMGPLQAGTDTREELLAQAQEGGPLRWDTVLS